MKDGEGMENAFFIIWESCTNFDLLWPSLLGVFLQQVRQAAHLEDF